MSEDTKPDTSDSRPPESGRQVEPPPHTEPAPPFNPDYDLITYIEKDQRPGK